MSNPWQIVYSFDGENKMLVGDVFQNATICEISKGGAGGVKSVMLERAHLIAAAPEMLALLKRNQSALRKIIDPNVAVDVDYRGWLESVDQVIALVEGGAA